MNVEVIGTLLFIFAMLTSLITQGVKKSLDELKVEYASNLIVGVVSVVVAGVGTAVFYLWNNYEWTSLHIISLFLMVLANWLVAMFGYDKVIQTITQTAELLKKIRR